MSYIARKPLLDALEELKEFWGFTFTADGVAEAIAEVEEAPTADVVEVRHGKWYKHDKKKHGDTCYHCSVCENYALSDCMIWELTDYCPHCGAKMDS